MLCQFKTLGKYIYFEICKHLGCSCNTWGKLLFFIEICKHLGCFWNTWESFFLIEICKACGHIHLGCFLEGRGGLGEWRWGLLACIYTVRLEFDLPAHHILVVVLSIHNGNFLEPWDQQIILRLTKPGDSSDFWFCLGLLACLLCTYICFEICSTYSQFGGSQELFFSKLIRNDWSGELSNTNSYYGFFLGEKTSLVPLDNKFLIFSKISTVEEQVLKKYFFLCCAFVIVTTQWLVFSFQQFWQILI